MERKSYPSDVTDEQWAILKRLILSALPGENGKMGKMVTLYANH
jgi:hypothetical protein